MTVTESIRVYLEPELKAEIRARAQHANRSMSNIINTLLKELIASQAKENGRANRSIPLTADERN